MMDNIPSETPPPNLHDLAEDHYFSANPPPKALEKHVALAREFIDYHAAVGRPVVLITSGGTTVPLGKTGLVMFSAGGRSREWVVTRLAANFG
jgi:phosphopantothenate---cysteine ligase (ATP)